MLRDDSDETYNFVLDALNNETALELINSSYTVYGMYRDRVAPNFARVLEFPADAIFSMWVMVVRHNNEISINSRLAGHSDEFRQDKLITFLTENLSLFSIMAEEDPGY